MQRTSSSLTVNSAASWTLSWPEALLTHSSERHRVRGVRLKLRSLFVLVWEKKIVGGHNLWPETDNNQAWAINFYRPYLTGTSHYTAGNDYNSYDMNHCSRHIHTESWLYMITLVYTHADSQHSHTHIMIWLVCVLWYMCSLDLLACPPAVFTVCCLFCKGATWNTGNHLELRELIQYM